MVLNTNFESINTVDKFESFIWTDRYSECGDFELFFPIDSVTLSCMASDNYLWFDSSEHMMIIEDQLIKTDSEEGTKLKVTGRSLESILDRRIVWTQTILSGNLQTCVKRLITENVINPSVADRKISNFIFEESTDPAITGLAMECQFTGDNLYEVVVGICDTFRIGFKITLNESNQFVFKLYAGADRSYSQDTNSYVVFSPKFDNLSNSSYIASKKTLKNITLIGGEGEGSERKYATVGSGLGLDRRELFTDARDISSKTDDRALTTAEYTAQLQQRGTDKLSENVYTESFEGLIDPTKMFVYGQDFEMGDIVQIVNEFGIQGTAYISEIVNSCSETGTEIYPTFKSIQ